MVHDITIAILYTPSELTPWKENINNETIQSIEENLPSHITSTRVEFSGFYHEDALYLRQFDIVLNLCYGYLDANQVDIALWLASYNIVHTGSHHEAMRIAQDKSTLPQICEQLGLKTPFMPNIESMIQSDLTYIEKPRFGSCHRGISILTPDQAKEKLMKKSEGMLIQEYVYGREFSVAVIPDIQGEYYEALNPVEIYPKSNHEIYIAGNGYVPTDKSFAPNIPPHLLAELKEIALKIHGYLGLSFMSRTDMRMDSEHGIFILDINTLPNLDPIRSLLPRICKNQGIELNDLLERIISMALKRRSQNDLVFNEMF